MLKLQINRRPPEHELALKITSLRFEDHTPYAEIVSFYGIAHPHLSH
jgi:hypothetical protein